MNYKMNHKKFLSRCVNVMAWTQPGIDQYRITAFSVRVHYADVTILTQKHSEIGAVIAMNQVLTDYQGNTTLGSAGGDG